jgi:hypothetical protein
MSSPWTTSSTSRLSNGAGGVDLRDTTCLSRSSVSCGEAPRWRSTPRAFWQWKSNRARARPATKPSRVVRAVSTRWAATSCTVHSPQSDGSSHRAAPRSFRSSISAARSACTIGQTSPTLSSYGQPKHLLGETCGAAGSHRPPASALLPACGRVPVADGFVGAAEELGLRQPSGRDRTHC